MVCQHMISLLFILSCRKERFTELIEQTVNKKADIILLVLTKLFFTLINKRIQFIVIAERLETFGQCIHYICP